MHQICSVFIICQQFSSTPQSPQPPFILTPQPTLHSQLPTPHFLLPTPYSPVNVGNVNYLTGHHNKWNSKPVTLKNLTSWAGECQVESNWRSKCIALVNKPNKTERENIYNVSSAIHICTWITSYLTVISPMIWTLVTSDKGRIWKKVG